MSERGACEELWINADDDADQVFFFFQAEDGIRDYKVTGVQTCALPISGRGGSGSEHARQQQMAIVRLLLERGASPVDRDGKGKQVRQAATNEWIRTLLMRSEERRCRERV